MNGLDLFSGIGGNTLGLRQYVKTVAYCETNRHAQSVLLSRMVDGSIERAPIWDNIGTLKGSMFDIPIHIILGGFPCQDISSAGNGTGLEGKRSGLFYELCRLVDEIKPAFVFLENVPTIRTKGLREVIRSLTDLRYDCRWTSLSAYEVGAPHIRKRWFLLAHANDGNRRQLSELSKKDAVEKRPKEQHKDAPNKPGYAGENPGQDWWKIEPGMGRMVNGLPRRMDRIKRLGNAVVPLQAKTAFETLMGKNNK